MSLTTVFGGPGCGKTTRLLNIVDRELKAGVSSRQICYTTFTRKAAQEARDRAAKKFDLDPKEDLPWFRTLHSLAFKSLGLTPDQVLSADNYREIAAYCGNLPITAGRVDEDLGIWQGTQDGDKCIFIDQLARSTRRSRVDICGELAVDHFMVDHWSRTLARWKEVNHFLDFTDMLEQAVTRNALPSCRVLVVDEAQDLSPLQWDLVRALAARAERVYIGGDDDQAIYHWSGADVVQFLDIAKKGRIEVLPKSFRLPRNIFDVCNRLAARIGTRQAKDWQPAREGGVVDARTAIDYVDFSQKNGTWYVLARNWYLLGEARTFMYRHGIPFMWKGRSSLDTPYSHAAMAWTALQRGGSIALPEVRNLYALLKSGAVEQPFRRCRGMPTAEYSIRDLVEWGLLAADTPWHEILQINAEQKHYIRMVRQNGYKLSVHPWITLSTIHQVKGGEADNVWLDTNMSRRSWASLDTDPDSEHRTFYVGASRARRDLYIGLPTSEYAYTTSTGVTL